jgi:hypothetical protein
VEAAWLLPLEVRPEASPHPAKDAIVIAPVSVLVVARGASLSPDFIIGLVVVLAVVLFVIWLFCDT